METAKKKLTKIPTDERVIVDPEDTTATGGRMMTYGERIVLGNILDTAKSGNVNESDTRFLVYAGVIETLHPSVDTQPSMENIIYVEEILRGILTWAKREREHLHSEATADEKAAGIEKLYEKCGKQLVLQELARAHGKSVDEVQRWPYPTVFMIQFCDVQKDKFRKALERRMKAKQKKGKKSWQGK